MTPTRSKPASSAVTAMMVSSGGTYPSFPLVAKLIPPARCRQPGQYGGPRERWRKRTNPPVPPQRVDRRTGARMRAGDTLDGLPWSMLRTVRRTVRDTRGPGWRHCFPSCSPGSVRRTPASAGVALLLALPVLAPHRRPPSLALNGAGDLAQRPAVEQLPGRGHRGERRRSLAGARSPSPTPGLRRRRPSPRAPHRPDHRRRSWWRRPSPCTRGSASWSPSSTTRCARCSGRHLIAAARRRPSPPDDERRPRSREPTEHAVSTAGTARSASTSCWSGPMPHPSRDAVLTDVILVVSVDPVTGRRR